MGAKRTKRLPTIERLRESLRYDPVTGALYWIRKAGNYPPGSPAGRLDPKDGYKSLQIDWVGILCHRVCWALHTGAWPKEQIDHINGDKSDNRIENLREATHAQNMRNKRGWGKSGVKGVCWIEADQKWRANIGLGRKVIYLGQFDTIEEATAVYIEAADRIQGEFALHRRNA